MKEKKMWLWKKGTFNLIEQVYNKLDNAPIEHIISAAVGISVKYVMSLENKPEDEEEVMRMAYEIVDEMFEKHSALLKSVELAFQTAEEK